ncbi:uncharacterized protein LOC143884341 isoform X2 [Tasmannia lanceolata]|uniref:uncharacterized protein LOC143884341 isoform X2 n=1 Tax=Tasmannia lanceolata TaxID=3420 RepID=UPI004063D0A4
MKLLIFLFFALAFLRQISADFPIRSRVSQKFILGEENLAPWATGLLRFAPASGPANAAAPDAKFPLVLAAKRTNRPDILCKFRRYRDGWDITNRHYWASVGFTGAVGFILASLWFVSFGFVLAVHRCCRWGISLQKKSTRRSLRICLSLLLVFTCAAAQCALIVVAAVMLVLALLGLLFSILAHQHAIYIFIFSGWLLVAITFILCGVFVIVNNAISDTCMAMEEYVENPQAETALSNILPCVDEWTTNQTLYQSKEVIHQLVNVVNTAIYTIANPNPPEGTPYYYNQSGPLIPPLCSPLDSQLQNRQCRPEEVSFANASMVWQNYTCEVSESGLCVSPGRVTPELYMQLVAAVNVSYTLDHYAPLLLNLQDCHFVRETFTTITTVYCPHLEHYLGMLNAGLALISVGVMLCLVLWILYANRPRREEVFARLSVVKDADSNEGNLGSI